MSSDTQALAWLRYRYDPVAFCREQLGVENDPWQERVLSALADPSVDRVFVRSGHGPGKTRLAAEAILWAGLTWGKCRIPCTAPKQATLSNKLWPEVNAILRSSPHLYLRQAIRWSKRKVEFFGVPGWEAIAETASDPEGLAGHHEDRVLFIAEESSGIRDEFFPVIEGALTTKGSKALFISNPTRQTGFFANAFRESREETRLFQVGYGEKEIGQKSHTETGVPLEAWTSSRPDKGWAEKQIRQYGEDSNIVRVRVKGLPPKTGDDALVGSELVWQAHGRQGNPEGMTVWSWDVAGAGRDRSVLSVRIGNHVKSLRELPDVNLLNASDRMAQYIDTDQPDAVHIDTVGIGQGPVDFLKGKGYRVCGVNVGASGGEEFANLRAEAYWKLRTDFMEERIGLDKTIPVEVVDALASELEATQWTLTPSGKIQILPKDRVKQRLGRSPDLADALMLHYAGLDKQVHSFEPATLSRTRSSLADW